MKIVESINDFHEFLMKFKKCKSTVVPIMSDTKTHPAVNRLCVLFVVMENEGNYVIPFEHSEARNIPSNMVSLLESDNMVYTPSKKILSHLIPELADHLIDLKGLEYFATGDCLPEERFYTPYMRHMYGYFRETENLNKIIPIMQLVKFCEDYSKHLHKFTQEIQKGFTFHNDTVIPACTFMETSGIYVDSSLFSKFYGERSNSLIHKGLVYSEYNPYTTTGRVTNRFGGINFAAIDKKNGVREAYTSRFKKGRIVLIDFDSFHLRLIAEMIKYELPSEPFHEHLGKQYFQTSSLTPEQYDEGKQITFRYLYSEKCEGEKYPFFAKVYEFRDKLWESIQQHKEYTMPHTGRVIYLNRIESPSAAKVFNYCLQLRETEVAMYSVNRLRRVYDNYNSKVILYTYDSIMIDYDLNDGKELLVESVNALENDGRYPVKIYVGANYNDLSNVTHMIKKHC